MGEAGYGIGQAYLHYKRDGSTLDHDIHIFAFIAEDFYRMQLYRFNGYEKPVLELQDGDIVSRNVPVPRRTYYVPWLTHNRETFTKLRSVELGRRTSKGLFSQKTPSKVWIDDPVGHVAVKVFETLDHMNSAKDSTLVLVFLEQSAARGGIRSEQLRQFVSIESKKRNILFIDLVGEFERLPYQKREELFDPQWYHYSAKGNAYVADLLYKQLLSKFQVPNHKPNFGPEF